MFNLWKMERQALLLIMVTKCKQANLGLHTLHQESTSIVGLTTQTIYKQFADWANDNKHKYINKKARLSGLAFLLRIGLKDVSS